MSDIKTLIANSAGRGVWIGLFPNLPNVALEEARLSYHDQSDGLAGLDDVKTLEEMHITLFHFGRNVRAGTIELIHAALWVFAESQLGDITVSVEGGIRLPNHTGLLVAPAKILRARQTLLGMLSDRHVAPDDRFEGVPHMTLWKHKYKNDVARIPRVQPFTVTFGGVTLVVGDHRVEMKFAPSPF